MHIPRELQADVERLAAEKGVTADAIVDAALRSYVYRRTAPDRVHHSSDWGPAEDWTDWIDATADQSPTAPTRSPTGDPVDDDYATAWDEWSDSDDERAWDSTTADGLTRPHAPAAPNAEAPDTGHTPDSGNPPNADQPPDSG